MWRSWSVVLPMILVVVLDAGARPSASQGLPALDRSKVEELVAFGRLWGEVEFVHPWRYSRDVDWDAAFLAVVPKALDSRGPEEFRSAVAELLGVLDDPVTRVVPSAAGAAAAHERKEAPAALEHDANGIVLVRAPTTDAGVAVLRRLASEPREPPLTGAILDLRGAVEPRALDAHRVALELALASLLHGRCALPSWRHVKHSGYPPHRGQTSGGYTREFQATPARWIEGEAARAVPLVIVVDERPRGVGDHLVALQLGGHARILLESEHETWDEHADGLALVHLDLPYGLRAEIRASERIGPSGETGFRPDLHLEPAADPGEALRRARSILGGELVLERPQYARTSSALVHRPLRDHAGPGAPAAELRLLALFRYWCTLASFWPYTQRLDRPWDEILVDFVPRFLAAEDDTAYQRALAELAACTQDGHSYTISPLLMQAFGTGVPRVALRIVEDRPVVVTVLDPAITDVSVGDVLLAVDGHPIAERIEALRPLLPHSTPQGLADKLRDLLLGGEERTVARATFEGARGVHECALERTESFVLPVRTTPVFGLLPSGHGYMDLERLEVEQVEAAFEAVAAAPGLVFDVRGYVNPTAPAIGPHLGDGRAPVAAVFYRNQIGADGPGVRSSLRFEQRVPQRPEGMRPYDGPVVVLIDERAISRAEHCCLHLRAAAKRITFIGTPTNGTNGDVTNGVLPGGIPFGFTGHDVRFPDESHLQRRGIQPDIRVAPTIAGLRAGRDEVLERAVRFLESGE